MMIESTEESCLLEVGEFREKLRFAQTIAQTNCLENGTTDFKRSGKRLRYVLGMTWQR